MHGDKWQTFFYTFYYIYRQNGTLYENNDIIGRYLSAENNEKPIIYAWHEKRAYSDTSVRPLL